MLSIKNWEILAYALLKSVQLIVATDDQLRSHFWQLFKCEKNEACAPSRKKKYQLNQIYCFYNHFDNEEESKK